MLSNRKTSLIAYSFVLCHPSELAFIRRTHISDGLMRKRSCQRVSKHTHAQNPHHTLERSQEVDETVMKGY